MELRLFRLQHPLDYLAQVLFEEIKLWVAAEWQEITIILICWNTIALIAD